MVKFTSWRTDLKVSVRQRWSKSISSGLAAGHRQYRHLFQDAESHSDPDLLPDTAIEAIEGQAIERAIEGDREAIEGDREAIEDRGRIEDPRIGSRSDRGTVTLIGRSGPNPCGIVSSLTSKPPNCSRRHAVAPESHPRTGLR